ncbi:MAG: aspartate kinase [Planctomycetota bacterium]
MRILKFGGTSVGSPENIERVGDIVRGQAAKHDVVVVVSAHSGVTDTLLDLAKRAARGRYGLAALKKRHRDLYTAIGVDPGIVAALFSELDDILRGLTLVRELTPRTQDLVLSFGERISARGVAAYLECTGVAAHAVDAPAAGLRTDSRFGAAHPDTRCFGALRKNLSTKGSIPVVTGFIGKDKNNDVTTLGRSGSDFTATLIGAALRAEEVQIWTDVDGVMTADPRVVKDARSIPLLSIAEASELAYYGARVIHPATMLPAVENSIPVLVRNTSRPKSRGTMILAETPSSRRAVKSIASKRGTILITVASTRMLLQSGFMAKIFEVFARHELSVDLVATSEVTVSVTVDSDRNLKAVEKELGAFSDVKVDRNLAQVCVVGDGVRESVGAVAEVFGALRKARVPVRLISHGGTKINISFLVEEAAVEKAVRALHRTFFGE